MIEGKSTMFRIVVTTVAFGLAVCACNPQSGVTDPRVGSGVSSPSLDSGITSSNGGGARALGNQPGVTVGGTGPTDTQRPNGRGPGL